MLIVAIRTLIMYLVLLLAVRIMGKSELSKMSPFQLVIVFMIAELAAIPIDSADASLINGIIAITMLMFLQVLISFLSIKSESFKNFISGKPTMLIEKGKLNVKELTRQRISCTDPSRAASSRELSFYQRCGIRHIRIQRTAFGNTEGKEQASDS